MVNYNQRIQNMVERGILSQEQANNMAEAISDIQRDQVTVKTNVKKMSASLIAIICIGICLSTLLVGVIIYGGSTQIDEIQTVSETLNTTGEIGKMSNSNRSLLFFTGIFGIPLLILVIWTMLTYNTLVSKEEDVLVSWAQVESNLQRRADLIPNLVNTIKTYMAHEKDVLESVTEKRAGGLSEIVSSLNELDSTSNNLNDLTKNVKNKLEDETFMKALSKEQENVGQEINKLMGVVEDYPELRASDQFLALQAQLEGTENRINVTRMVFNDAVGKYNSSIRKIPGSFVAGMGSFKRKAYFQADSTAHNDVKVEF